MLGKLDIHMWNNEIKSVSITLHKTNSKYIKDPKTKHETLKTILEKNMSSALHNIGRKRIFK